MMVQVEQAERAAMHQRGEEDGMPLWPASRNVVAVDTDDRRVVGLPTYRQARAQPPAFASSYHYHIEPYQPPEGRPPSATAGRSHHFHFHLPSWPAALHLRPATSSQPQQDGMELPLYMPEPPKYEDVQQQDAAVPPPSGSPTPAAPESPAGGRDAEVRQADEHQRQVDFIHPEERRRMEEDRRREQQEEDLPTAQELASVPTMTASR